MALRQSTAKASREGLQGGDGWSRSSSRAFTSASVAAASFPCSARTRPR